VGHPRFRDKGEESNGKYTISIQFPNEDYGTANAEVFLTSLKAFEDQLLADAVKNSMVGKWIRYL
jgi:hypothetical protein